MFRKEVYAMLKKSFNRTAVNYLSGKPQSGELAA